MSYTKDMHSTAKRHGLPLVTIEYNGKPCGEGSVTLKGPTSKKFKKRILRLLSDIAAFRDDNLV